MKSKILFFLCLVPFLMATTCDDEREFGHPCTEEAAAALNISVHLGNASAPISGAGITVVATDGDFSETLTYYDETNPVFSGAYERAGTYIITVSKEGYQTYTSPVITVTADICHVIGQQRDITLLPE